MNPTHAFANHNPVVPGRDGRVAAVPAFGFAHSNSLVSVGTTPRSTHAASGLGNGLARAADSDVRTKQTVMGKGDAIECGGIHVNCIGADHEGGGNNEEDALELHNKVEFIQESELRSKVGSCRLKVVNRLTERENSGLFILKANSWAITARLTMPWSEAYGVIATSCSYVVDPWGSSSWFDKQALSPRFGSVSFGW